MGNGRSRQNDYEVSSGYAINFIFNAKIQKKEIDSIISKTKETMKTHNYGEYVEMVDTKIVKEYMEFDRRVNISNSLKDVENLSKDILKNGFKDPLIMGYNPKTGFTALIEGNNRLMIAEDLGITQLPVRVAKDTMETNVVNEITGVRRGGKVVPKSIMPHNEYYYPEEMKPSMVLPELNKESIKYEMFFNMETKKNDIKVYTE